MPPDVSQVHQPILVCTAHIHWDPEFCDVKLIQTMMLSNELRSILEEASHNFRPGHKADTNNIQLLLCGDFNSLPDSGTKSSDFHFIYRPNLIIVNKLNYLANSTAATCP